MKGKSMGAFGVVALLCIAAGASLNGQGLVGFWGMLLIMMLPHAASLIWAAKQKFLEKNQTV